MSTTLTTKPAPKYALIAEKIKGDILTGSLLPGSRLPSFAELQRDFGATTTTVGRVYSLLERDGLIDRQHGKGMFVRHRTARAPQTAKSSSLADRTVVVLSESLIPSEDHKQNGWSDYILSGVLSQSRDAHLYALAVNGHKSTQEMVKDILDASPYGVILPTTALRGGNAVEIALRLHEAGLNVVAYHNGDTLARMDRVVPDHEQGSYDLTKWLIARGRKRILNVWPPLINQYWYAARLRGYERAMTEAGLMPLPVVYPPYPEGVPTEAEYRENIRLVAGYMIEHITGPEPIDAIMLVSDGYAPETAEMLSLFGKTANEDVWIAGYDNYWQDMTNPYSPKINPIATVDKNNMEAGRALIKLLVDRRDGALPDAAQSVKIAQNVVEIFS